MALASAVVLVVSSAALVAVHQNYSERRDRFLDLRADAKTITLGMPLSEVTRILGEPDADDAWLKHFPKWRLYYFDIDRKNSLGRSPRSYVSVLVDSESGVQLVNVFDPEFETCSGNKIQSTCTPINRKHHDRFAGPVIVGG